MAVTIAAAQGSERTGRRWLARVQVSLKPVVNDPAGLSISEALRHLGFDGVDGVRAGKYFEIEIDAPIAADAKRIVSQAADKLLANPVIESYRIEVEEGVVA